MNKLDEGMFAQHWTNCIAPCFAATSRQKEQFCEQLDPRGAKVADEIDPKSKSQRQSSIFRKVIHM